MESWKTIKCEQVLDLSPFLKVEQHTVVLPDGQVIEKWPWIITPDFVNIAVITTEGEYLVFHQTKYSITGTTLAPVGGYIEPGEEPLATAKRELLEETGFVAENGKTWANLRWMATAAMESPIFSWHERRTRWLKLMPMTWKSRNCCA